MLPALLVQILQILHFMTSLLELSNNLSIIPYLFIEWIVTGDCFEFLSYAPIRNVIHTYPFI